MTTQRKIILAADLKADSAFAAKWANNLAQLTSAQVVLAHIIELSVPNWLRSAYDVLEDEQQRAKAEQKICDWYKLHTGQDAAGVIIRVGNPAEVLPEVIKEEDAAMLVIARSRKGLLQKFLVGSTAQMLAANPPCMVAIVHPDHTALDESTEIVVATDLTDTATKALVAAAVMSDKLKTRLDIVHTAKSAASIDVLDLPVELSSDALKEKAQEQLQAILDEHKETLDNVDAHAHVIEAEPVEGIKEFAEARKASLVFVGNAAKYNALANVFGRVSVKLTQQVESTVVIVPPQIEAFDALVNEKNHA